MSQLQLRNTEDGNMYEVCLEEDGIRKCCFVSSMHLVQDHEKQLRDAIKRESLKAFVADAAQRAICDV
jgi:ATP-dependent helicase YprA (DUF1998 family)